MPLRISLALLIALLVPSFAHAASACCEFCPDQYQQEGPFPYFEVIRTRRLIPDTSVATADGWKRIFEKLRAGRAGEHHGIDGRHCRRAVVSATHRSEHAGHGHRVPLAARPRSGRRELSIADERSVSARGRHQHRSAACRIGMQLVPVGAGACFSARDFGRAAATSTTPPVLALRIATSCTC